MFSWGSITIRNVIRTAVGLAVFVAVTGCDPPAAVTPLAPAYMSDYVIVGLVEDVNRTEVRIQDGVIYASMSSHGPPSDHYRPGHELGSTGDEIGDLSLVKQPAPPLWSRDRGGVYEPGVTYALFIYSPTWEEPPEVWAQLAFDPDTDLPIEPWASQPIIVQDQHTQGTASDILESLAKHFESSGTNRLLDGLIASVTAAHEAQESWLETCLPRRP